MKYGAGSALLSDVMARSSSCCRVCNNTGSLAPAAAVCPSNAGAANSERIRQRNKDFTDDMATDECTSSFRHRTCYVRCLPQSRAKARDPYGYEGYRVAGERSVSKTAYASHKSIPDNLLGEVGFPHPQKTQVRDFKSARCGKCHLSFPGALRRSRLPPQYRLSCRRRLIQPLHPRRVRCVLHELRI